MTSRWLARLGVGAPAPRRTGRWRPRALAERLPAIQSPRRVWLFGPELRPKTVPLARAR